MIKNKYTKEYSRYLKLNRHGRVVPDVAYTGNYYILPFSKEQKKKTALINFLAAFAILGLWIGAGLLNTASTRAFYTLYAYLFILLPMFYLFYGAFNYTAIPERMQLAQFELSLERLKHSTYGIMFMAGVSILCEIIFMIVHRSDLMTFKEITYLLCHVFMEFVCFLYGKFYEKNYSNIEIVPSEYKAE